MVKQDVFPLGLDENAIYNERTRSDAMSMHLRGSGELINLRYSIKHNLNRSQELDNK